MNKEKEIKDICKVICATCAQFDGCAINCKAHRDTAEALYNTGYRKSSEDSVVLSREEHEILVKTAQDKIGNMKATDFLKACISSGIMVEAVSTKEQDKQAVKEFAEKLKNVIHERDYVQGYAEIGLIEEIDELLKEYKK